MSAPAQHAQPGSRTYVLDNASESALQCVLAARLEIAAAVGGDAEALDRLERALDAAVLALRDLTEDGAV
ncbi:hypothetical protein DSM112329_01735 [Paraconexibacter sp. AEG42_29]|uniref:Uncharacterized protein n=1 Tax=Paraconexibacter sp. AEG42_29 TaxID=2997339 RepID=A0AAU7ATS5_9ACTN